MLHCAGHERRGGMHRTVRVGCLVAACALVCGCALRTEMLRPGMSMQEVNDMFGKPAGIYTEKVGGSFVEVTDYAREGTGIPNPLDDYGWIIPPTTRVVRAWFIDGKLTDWCGGSYTSYEQLKKLEMKCQLRVPPSFDPSVVPASVRNLQSQGR